MTCRNASLVLLWLLISTALSIGDNESCPTSANASPSLCEDYHCGHTYLTNRKCYCGLGNVHRVTAAQAPWLLQIGTANQSCTPRELRSAIFAFQKHYGLPPTELCDNATRGTILNPRCGAVATDRNALGSRSRSALSSILGAASGGRSTREIHVKTKSKVYRDIVEAPTYPLDEVREQSKPLYWQDLSSDEKEAVQSERDVATGNASDYAGRSKRQLPTENTVSFSTNALRYRITSYGSHLSTAYQDAAFAAAFRQWASITPLCFIRDTTSDISLVQLTIGFYDGPHPGDLQLFGGPGGELAHSLPGTFSHFDNSQNWYTSFGDAATGINLYSVAMHEVGHLLGIPHLSDPKAVMCPQYNSSRPAYVVSDSDRSAALSKYGPCNGSFDAIIDIIYSVPCFDDDGSWCQPYRYFSTYFFRGSYVWYYRYSLGRAYDNQPQPLAVYWTGLPNSLDAMCEFSSDTEEVIFAFKGSTVYLFNYTLGHAGYVYASYPISSYFPKGSIDQPIPNNIDSCYFDPRDGNMYFFKSTTVYVYAYDPLGPHSCCEATYDIKTRFPLAAGSTATVSGLTYQQNVDAVYISIYYNAQYFFVQNLVWKNENFDYYGYDASNNSMIYMGPWNLYWGFICNVVCP